MISSESRTKEWINELSQKFDYPNVVLIEKTIRAFSLLEALARSGLPFTFKGGSCLMLHFNTEKRLSIDIDIICPPGTDIEKYWEQYAAEYGFQKPELIERKQITDVPKKHAKYNYQVSCTDGGTEKILLDVLLEEQPYNNIEQLAIKSPFLKNEGPDILVNVPSKPDILGDKLTAFAPNTTGIPYEKTNSKGEKIDCSLEIIKQMFDVACLIDSLDDFSNVLEVYKKNVIVECGYRNLAQTTYIDVLNDTIGTSLCLACKGYVEKDSFTRLQNGVKKFKGFIYDKTPYTIEKAITDSSKVAYLCSSFIREQTALEKFDSSKTANLKDAQIEADVGSPLAKWTKLNRLKKSNIEAFFYWFKAFELLKN